MFKSFESAVLAEIDIYRIGKFCQSIKKVSFLFFWVETHRPHQHREPVFHLLKSTGDSSDSGLCFLSLELLEIILPEKLFFMLTCASLHFRCVISSNF